MSGRAFDYQEHKLTDMAFELENLIKTNNIRDDDNYARNYPDWILNIFSHAAKECNRLYELLHEIDYFICGDIGEEDLDNAYYTYIQDGERITK